MPASDADNPLNGKAPAPDQVRDARPEGRTPNEMVHQELKQEWKKRPEQYPATQEGLQNTDIPGRKQI